MGVVMFRLLMNIYGQTFKSFDCLLDGILAQRKGIHILKNAIFQTVLPDQFSLKSLYINIANFPPSSEDCHRSSRTHRVSLILQVGLHPY